MKKILLAALVCVALCACARTGQIPSETGNAAQIWQKMLAANAEDGPYRLQFSLRFGEEGNTRRVTGLLWGNDDSSLRMDIMAGVGAVLAMMADSPDRFLLYAPREHKAYEHNGPEKPLLKVGMPLPFNMAQLAALLNGHYAAVFGIKPESSEERDGNYLYQLDTPPGGQLALNADGCPESWKQTGDGWVLEIAYDDSKLPRQLKLSSGNRRAIIVVKERERPAQPFDNARMALEIPANTPVLPLSSYKPS